MSDIICKYLKTKTKTSILKLEKSNCSIDEAKSLSHENNIISEEDKMFLGKLYYLLGENLDNQNFNLNDLAKELFLNRTTFYRKVKTFTNLTPFQLLKKIRLKKAAEILIQNRVSVNEVFVMTGFKSRTHFTKVFKEKYNISPSKYASKILEQ